MGRHDETHLDYSEVLTAMQPLPLRTLCFVNALLVSAGILGALNAGEFRTGAEPQHSSWAVFLWVPAIYWITWTRSVPVSRLKRVGALWTIVLIAFGGPSVMNQVDALLALPNGHLMLADALPELRSQASSSAVFGCIAVLALLRPTPGPHDATPPQA